MKSIRIFYIVLCVIILVTVSPTVSAYMLKRTSVVNNEFVPAYVTCQLHEVFENNAKTSIQVENTGNIEAYIRLRVLSYWQDSKGNAVAIDRDPPSITPDSSTWIEDTTGSRDTVNTFYCKVPIAAGDKTPELLSSGTSITLETMTKTDDSGVVYVYNQVVEIIAEAIQSKPTSAVEDSWKVTIEAVNGVNVITAVN